ncbi:hypothetical protein BpHYR1_012779, partial [Brachionus plicatilis]
MLHSTGFDCLLNAFFAANLAASDDSTVTKAISLFKYKIFFKQIKAIFHHVIQQTLCPLNLKINGDGHNIK